ncbi:MAG: GtrA family protein [Oscillospiraceae bacterium]|nr:GtrA family protein [Oscillospiraceae bacterium]
MTEKKKDIFDRIMSLPILNILEPFYTRHKEVLLYLFFGGLAFFLNLGLFVFFIEVLQFNEHPSNIISWIICVLFQFFTNRTWVFDSTNNEQTDFFKQLTSFFGGRIFTLAVEEVILIIFITCLSFNSFAVKLIAQIIVIVLNYIISKLFVFK